VDPATRGATAAPTGTTGARRDAAAGRLGQPADPGRATGGIVFLLVEVQNGLAVGIREVGGEVSERLLGRLLLWNALNAEHLQRPLAVQLEKCHLNTM